MATDAKSDCCVARVLAGVAAAVAVSLALPLHAAGAPPPRPGDVSAVAQYFETIPTSEGERLSGPRGGAAAPLPPAVEARVRSDAGADAPALIELATSPERGAPPKPTPDAAAGDPTAPAVAAPAVAAPSFTDAAGDAALGGRSSRLLLPLLGLISVGLVTAALVGRRRRGSFR